ncbi:MAG: ATP-binding cassette domain-containing protein, partial [Candidatus Methylumidiphilus sp.]
SPIEYRRTGKLGFVFQQFELLPFLSVRDNIIWPLKYSPLVSNLDPSHIMDIDVVIDAVGLHEAHHKMPHELSGGMKARVAIARAIITRPSLLLVDEAFSALDVGWRTSLHRLIKRLSDQFSMTTLIVSHNLDDVVTYADTCLVLSASGTGATFIEFGAISRSETMERLRAAILIGHQANSHDQS